MSVRTSIVKLENEIQPYAWGSHSAIAKLQGRPTPTDAPEAELWIGDHPNGASRVVEAGGTTPLAAWCAERGDAALGRDCERLPYLVKILAAREPLSIQLHPDAHQAADGYAREEAAGIALGDACRSYSDRNAKVEALCALGRFEALCGLRPDAEVRKWVAKSRSGVAAELLAEAGEGAPEQELAGALFHHILKVSNETPLRTRQLADEMTQYADAVEAGPDNPDNSDNSAETRWIGRLARAYPGDRMLIAPLLLNHVVLERGQALEISPNTVHSYLCGTGVEVMTSSDNVVRGGLTPKHVAQGEFTRLLDTRAAAPRICQAPIGASGVIAPYPLQIDAFRISQVRVRPGNTREELTAGAGQPRILLSVSGTLELQELGAGRTVAVSAGQAALIPACVGGFEIRGDGEGFLVEPGVQVA